MAERCILCGYDAPACDLLMALVGGGDGAAHSTCNAAVERERARIMRVDAAAHTLSLWAVVGMHAPFT